PAVRFLPKNLPRMFLEMLANCLERSRPGLLPLLSSHAANPGKLPVTGWVFPGHLAQCHIRKHNISRHMALICQALSQLSQDLEQFLVTCDFTHSPPWLPLDCLQFRQPHGFAFFENGHPSPG